MHEPSQGTSNARLVDENEEVKKGCCRRILDYGNRSKVVTVINDTKMNKMNSVKIIVVGPGNSGKSTILKQMRIIHGSNYSESDRIKFKPLVIENLLDSILILVNTMRHVFDQEFENDDNEDHFDKVLTAKAMLEAGFGESSDWDVNSQMYAESITSIWNDLAVKLVYEQRNRYYLADSAEYFITNVTRLCGQNYIPNIDDVLRARQPTTDIKEYAFNIKGTFFNFVDVSGQRSERRKWINALEDISSMIFVTSLADFDQAMSENELQASGSVKRGETVNQMKESLDLFYTIINWQKEADSTVSLFENIPIILFLNKEDLFEEKFSKRASIRHCFPDFDENLSLNEAKEFIANKFVKCDRFQNDLYYHYTFALNTKNIATVIGVVRDSILRKMAQSARLF